MYDDDTWLSCSYESVYNACDAVYFLVGTKPWNGPVTDNQKTINLIRGLPDPNNKVSVIIDNWANETEQRNAGLELLTQANINYCFVVDGDEVYDTDVLKRMMNHVTQQPKVACWHMTWDTYWKSCQYVIIPREPFKPIVFVKVGASKFVNYRSVSNDRGNLIPSEIGFCHHLSYARSNQHMKNKLTTFSHASEVLTGWYDRVWLGWDNDKDMVNLHPTHPTCYGRAIFRPVEQLPQALKRHG